MNDVPAGHVANPTQVKESEDPKQTVLGANLILDSFCYG